MKNLTLFVSSIIMLGMMSCGKEYTCHCKQPFTGTQDFTVKGATRAAAKKKCYEKGKDKGQPTYDGPFDCYLKS